MSRIVQVKVQEIRPGGLIVKFLVDGRHGYIRRRELSWDRRIRAQPPMPSVGALIEAKLIDDPSVLHYTPLSVRQLTDPSQNAKGKYRKGDSVRGEVVNARTNGLFIQIEPGIDAFLPIEEFPVPLGQSVEFLPMIGDQIEAKITMVDEGNHQIQLSVLTHLRDLQQLSFEQQKTLLLKRFKEAVNRPSSLDGVTSEPTSPQKKAGGTTQRYRPPLSRFERVLIVDDEEHYLLELWDTLEDIFDVIVSGSQSSSDAVAIISGRLTFDLVLIDMTLNGESGIEIARKLLSVRPHLEIIFISNNPIKEKDIPSLFGRRFQFANKQSEEIVGVIEKVLDGYWEPIANAQGALATDKGGFIRQLGIIAESAEPTPNKLAQMLAALKKNIAVTHVFLFEVDTRSQSVSIMAGDPSLSKEARGKAEANLYYSPARNVAEEEEEFYWTVDEVHRARELQNFLPQLPFKSCLGIPIKLTGSSTRYALFLLEEHVRNFNRETLDQIRISAQFLQLTLERMFIFDHMRRYEQRYTMGLLLNSLVHEAANKLDALNAQVQILPLILQQTEQATTLAEQHERLTEAKEVAHKLLMVKQDLTTLFDSYSRAVIGKLEVVDVHLVINKITQQLATRAREAGVVIETQLLCQSPQVYTIQPRLEQVLTNLLLNAIQQIERQHKAFAPSASTRGKTIVLPQPGLVLVQTQYLASREPFPVQVMVMDTGPGVHYQEQDDIFLLDTSKRKEGQGLGLFISRSLLEMMGGRLYLADSLLSIGSAFVVGLSVAPQMKE